MALQVFLLINYQLVILGMHMTQAPTTDSMRLLVIYGSYGSDSGLCSSFIVTGAVCSLLKQSVK